MQFSLHQLCQWHLSAILLNINPALQTLSFLYVGVSPICSAFHAKFPILHPSLLSSPPVHHLGINSPLKTNYCSSWSITQSVVPPIQFLELESDTYFVTNNLTVFPFQLCSLLDISTRLLSTSQTVFNATPMRLSSHKSLAIILMLFMTHCVSYLTFLFNGIMLIKAFVYDL